jgi:hypothetical protein
MLLLGAMHGLACAGGGEREPAAPQIVVPGPPATPAQGDPAPPRSPSTDRGRQAADPTHGFTCAMHPAVFLGEPGTCPICGMDLIETPVVDEEP